MFRKVVLPASVLGLALLATETVIAWPGNAFSSPSSKVGPALAAPRSKPRRAAPPDISGAVSAPRIPMRNAVPYRPTISPYLNLFRPEASRIFNYYTLVKPQLAQQQINQQQSALLQSLQQQVESAPAGGGQRLFQNHDKYFGGRR